MCTYDDFVKDYNNMDLTTHDVRRINSLNSRKYRELREIAISNGDIPVNRHMNASNAKFYYQKPNGCWVVEKQFLHSPNIIVGDFPDEETAKLVVEKCKSVNWNIDKIKWFIDKKKLSNVKNYSLTNGYWVIQKTVNGQLETFLVIKENKVGEEIIKKIVKMFRDVNWNKDYTDFILGYFGIY